APTGTPPREPEIHPRASNARGNRPSRSGSRDRSRPARWTHPARSTHTARPGSCPRSRGTKAMRMVRASDGRASSSWSAHSLASVSVVEAGLSRGTLLPVELDVDDHGIPLARADPAVGSPARDRDFEQLVRTEKRERGARLGVLIGSVDRPDDLAVDPDPHRMVSHGGVELLARNVGDDV